MSEILTLAAIIMAIMLHKTSSSKRGYMLAVEFIIAYGVYIYTVDMIDGTWFDNIKMLIAMAFVPAFLIVGAPYLSIISVVIVTYHMMLSHGLSTEYYGYIMFFISLMQLIVMWLDRGVVNGTSRNRSTDSSTRDDTRRFNII